ncbi:hypothetical protein [Butyrivibrio sp. JL13D10]|uniref:NHL domain-containing protein n=1 Tax=Butyrivibrio sp. JL13D10 TaxID=3236815 RepID=UPI0038B4BF98
MNKKKKNGLKWVLLVIVLIITGFTVTMVACGLFKEKSTEKASEDENASEEGLYDSSDSADSVPDSKDYEGISTNEENIDFDLSVLPDTVEPCGICSYDGCLYVTDTFSKCVWQVSAEGVSILAGADSSRDIYDKPQGGYNDASAEEALFKLPWDVAPFLSGIAVSDTDNNVVRIISNNEVNTINSVSGNDEYNYPTGIASDGAGHLFVSDTHSDSVKIITESGEVSTFADGLESPMGISFNAGYLYIAESGKNRIVRINATDVSSKKNEGDIEIVAGTGEEGDKDGLAAEATFASPKGIAVSGDGTVFVADTVNSAVRIIKDGQVNTMEIKDDRNPDIAPVSPIGLCIQGRRLYICDNFSKKIFTSDI